VKLMNKLVLEGLRYTECLARFRPLIIGRLMYLYMIVLLFSLHLFRVRCLQYTMAQTRRAHYRNRLRRANIERFCQQGVRRPHD